MELLRPRVFTQSVDPTGLNLRCSTRGILRQRVIAKALDGFQWMRIKFLA